MSDPLLTAPEELITLQEHQTTVEYLENQLRLALASEAYLIKLVETAIAPDISQVDNCAWCGNLLGEEEHDWRCDAIKTVVGYKCGAQMRNEEYEARIKELEARAALVKRERDELRDALKWERVAFEERRKRLDRAERENHATTCALMQRDEQLAKAEAQCAAMRAALELGQATTDGQLRRRIDAALATDAGAQLLAAVRKAIEALERHRSGVMTSRDNIGEALAALHEVCDGQQSASDQLKATLSKLWKVIEEEVDITWNGAPNFAMRLTNEFGEEIRKVLK